jgi:four helix bundle protein
MEISFSHYFMSFSRAIGTYKDLIVWQKSMALVTEIYILTSKYPSDERFGLISQMCRAAVSIPSNIAEGKRQSTQKSYLHFLRISFGSGSELEQIEISKRLSQTSNLDFSKVDSLLDEVMRMLNVMIQKP